MRKHIRRFLLMLAMLCTMLACTVTAGAAATPISITTSNIADYFTVTNGGYYFAGSGSTWTTNNGGVHSSTATTTLTAKEDFSNVSFSYSWSSEVNYDKFTLTCAGTTVQSAVSGATTTKTWSGALTAGQTLSFTYTKDGSANSNNDQCTFSAMSVTRAVDPNAIAVTVPVNLPITVNASGNVVTATNAEIVNSSSFNVIVDSIQVTASTGWTVDTAANVRGAGAGEKKINLSFFGNECNASGAVDVSAVDSVPAAGGKLAMPYDATIPGAVTASASASAAKAVIVVKKEPTAPTFAPNSTWYKGTTGKNTITKINIVRSYTPTGSETESWNADVDNTGSIKCYVTGTELIIAGNGAKKIMSNADSSSMFSGTTSATQFRAVTSITGLELLDTANVTKMDFMFQNCSGLTSLDVSSFNTANVTGMNSMFDNCASLTTLDVSNFNTANVTNMGGMFISCQSLTSLDVTNFNTANVTSMRFIFHYCRALTSLNVSSFDTANVTDMSYMFYNCSGLTSLDVSNFDTSKVTNMYKMFQNCSGLTTIYASDKWTTAGVTNSSYMFTKCTSLRGDIAYDSSYPGKTYAKTSGGYLTYKAAPATLSLVYDAENGAVTGYDVAA